MMLAACASTPPVVVTPSAVAPEKRFARTDVAGFGRAWIDQATGLAWGDPLPGTHARDHAERSCAERSAQLPSVEQLKDAEAGGLMALAPDTWTGAWFWTSSSSPPVFLGMLARAYQGPPLGYVVNLATDDRISARCVRRTHD
jgi:hypothetical protein